MLFARAFLPDNRLTSVGTEWIVACVSWVFWIGTLFASAPLR